MPTKLPDLRDQRVAQVARGVGEDRQISGGCARGRDGGSDRLLGRRVYGRGVDVTGGRRNDRRGDGIRAQEGRGGQAAEGFRVGGFERVGNADQQHARLLGLAFGLHAEPARLTSVEDFQRNARGAACAEQRTVVAAGIDGDVLHFLPEWRAAGLILVEGEDDADGSGGSAGDGSAELHQMRNGDIVFRIGTAEQQDDAKQSRQEAAGVRDERARS